MDLNIAPPRRGSFECVIVNEKNEGRADLQTRALDKRENLMILFLISQPYVVTPHLNRLAETVQMRGHNICFNGKIRKIIHNLSSYPFLPGALDSW